MTNLLDQLHIHSFTDHVVFGILIMLLVPPLVVSVLKFLLELLPDPSRKLAEPIALPVPAGQRSPFPYCPACFGQHYEALGSTYETWKQWRCKNCRAKTSI